MAHKSKSLHCRLFCERLIFRDGQILISYTKSVSNYLLAIDLMYNYFLFLFYQGELKKEKTKPHPSLIFDTSSA